METMNIVSIRKMSFRLPNLKKIYSICDTRRHLGILKTSFCLHSVCTSIANGNKRKSIKILLQAHEKKFLAHKTKKGGKRREIRDRVMSEKNVIRRAYLKLETQFSIINHQLSIINFQFSIINYQLSTINYQLTNYVYQSKSNRD